VVPPLVVAEQLEATASWGHPRVVAVGFFDGVHRGHQELLRRLWLAAGSLGGTGIVLTFHPHPLALLRPELQPPLLTGFSHKLQLLELAGAQHLLVLPFGDDLRQLDPGSFVRQILADGLKARAVLVGFNFTFGYRGQGNADTLQALASRHGIAVEVVPPVRVRGSVVSSTVIRQCLLEGQVERARELLGRPHRLCGRVMPGSGRGRGLGFPTCNLAMEAGVLVPGRGVYDVRVTLPGGARALGVCNIGSRPTFHGQDTGVEVHIIDHHQDRYGEILCVDLMSRLRGELRFPSAQDLARQIRRDIAQVRRAGSEAD